MLCLYMYTQTSMLVLVLVVVYISMHILFMPVHIYPNAKCAGTLKAHSQIQFQAIRIANRK